MAKETLKNPGDIIETREFERKFITSIDQIPYTLGELPNEQIHQAYLSEADEDWELRVRKILSENKDPSYTATLKCKLPDHSQRIELDIPIIEEAYTVSLDETQAEISKTRFSAPGGIKLDLLDNQFGAYAEIEFPSLKEAESYCPPEWLGYELTGDSSGYNRNLATPAAAQIDPRTPHDMVELIRRVNQQLKSNRPVTLGIAGPSAAGKSTVISELTAALGSTCSVISVDDYIIGKTKIEQQQGTDAEINWDLPDIYDTHKLSQDIFRLAKLGEAIIKPIYNFQTGEPDATERLMPAPVTIVEGLYALDFDILKHLDFSAYLEAPVALRAIRRILRDVSRTGQSPAEIFKYFMDAVQPATKKYVQPQKKLAEFVISGC